jgi:hypothetical protein
VGTIAERHELAHVLIAFATPRHELSGDSGCGWIRVVAGFGLWLIDGLIGNLTCSLGRVVGLWLGP